MNVYGCDPRLTVSEIRHFGATPLPELDKKMDAVIIAVAHKQFKKMTIQEIRKLMNDHPVLIDVRGMLDLKIKEEKNLYYRRL